MELILKQPEAKPPFIGILFSNEYEASKLNQSQVKMNNLYYRIMLEPKGRTIDIILKLDEWAFTYKYEGLEYNADKLKRWLFNCNGSEYYNFSHLIMKNNQHQVVKTLSTQSFFVLKVNEIKLFQEEYT
jgi:hypothetical protein